MLHLQNVHHCDSLRTVNARRLDIHSAVSAVVFATLGIQFWEVLREPAWIVKNGITVILSVLQMVCRYSFPVWLFEFLHSLVALLSLNCSNTLEPVLNGYVSYSKTDFTLGTTASFLCHGGYVINGTATLLCTLEGSTAVWSHKPPTCDSMIEKIFVDFKFASVCVV